MGTQYKARLEVANTDGEREYSIEAEQQYRGGLISSRSNLKQALSDIKKSESAAGGQQDRIRVLEHLIFSIESELVEKFGWVRPDPLKIGAHTREIEMKGILQQLDQPNPNDMDRFIQPGEAEHWIEFQHVYPWGDVMRVPCGPDHNVKAAWKDAQRRQDCGAEVENFDPDPEFFGDEKILAFDEHGLQIYHSDDDEPLEDDDE